MSEYRVCNTEDLIHLLQLDRGAPRVDKNLDPKATHVLRRVIYGHNMDSSEVLHYRCQVMVAVLSADEPVMILLDVEDSIWERLHSVESVLGKTTEKEGS